MNGLFWPLHTRAIDLEHPLQLSWLPLSMNWVYAPSGYLLGMLSRGV